MRDSLLHWGAEVFPQQPPRSLNQLADLMENSELKQQFSQLDQSLFKADSGKDFEVESKTIVKILKSFTTNGIEKIRGTQLKSLYPEYRS
jgi:hypothetical protein